MVNVSPNTSGLKCKIDVVKALMWSYKMASPTSDMFTQYSFTIGQSGWGFPLDISEHKLRIHSSCTFAKQDPCPCALGPQNFHLHNKRVVLHNLKYIAAILTDCIYLWSRQEIVHDARRLQKLRIVSWESHTQLPCSVLLVDMYLAPNSVDILKH